VVIGVALSLACEGLISKEQGLEGITISTLSLFVAFVVTLVPFYHGALRHMDDTYIHNQQALQSQDMALIVDFLLLFLHAITFIVLSLLIAKPNHFSWVICFVLLIDVAWGVFAYCTSPSPKALTAEGKWTIINFVFVVVGITTLFWLDVSLDQKTSDNKLAILIASACLIRSFFDYVWCRDFYFPQEPK
ncbi:MAG: hypothetical protein AB7O69_11835, partial [Burkholderiales bacterium]